MSNIPAGRYVGRARPEIYVVPTGSGSPQVALDVDLLNDGYEDVTVGWYGSLSGGAVPITMRQLRAAGWTGDSFKDPAGIGSVEVDVAIKYEEYQGEQKMKVAIWAKGSGGVRKDKRLVGTELDALDRQFRGDIIRSKSEGGAKPQTRGGPAPF